MSDANEPEYILPECNFAELKTGTEDGNECSPRFPDPFTEFRGIVINGPKEMVWPKGAEPQEASPFGSTDGPARLMIAARYRLPFHLLGLDNTFGSALLFVAVNQKTKAVYSGRIPMFGEREPIPDADPNMIIGGWADADLVNIAGVPIANATYTVYASLGEYKSNVLTIKTMVK